MSTEKAAPFNKGELLPFCITSPCTNTKIDANANGNINRFPTRKHLGFIDRTARATLG